MLTTVMNRAGVRPNRAFRNHLFPAKPNPRAVSRRRPEAWPHPRRRPAVARESVAERLAARLRRQAEQNGLGRVFCAPSDVLLDKGVVARPDVFFVRERRRGAVGGCRGKERLYGVPDLAIDIQPDVRPDPASLAERSLRRRLYSQFGVPELWTIDPDRRQGEVFLWSELGYVSVGVRHVSEQIRSIRFPGISLSLAGIFQ